MLLVLDELFNWRWCWELDVLNNVKMTTASITIRITLNFTVWCANQTSWLSNVSSDEKWMYVMSEKFSSFDGVSQLGQMFTSSVESKIEVNNYTITTVWDCCS